MTLFYYPNYQKENECNLRIISFGQKCSITITYEYLSRNNIYVPLRNMIRSIEYVPDAYKDTWKVFEYRYDLPQWDSDLEPIIVDIIRQKLQLSCLLKIIIDIEYYSRFFSYTARLLFTMQA